MDVGTDAPGDITMVFEQARAKKMYGSGGKRFHVPRMEDLMQQNQHPAFPDCQPVQSKGLHGGGDVMPMELRQREPSKVESQSERSSQPERPRQPERPSQTERPIPSRNYPSLAAPVNTVTSSASYYPPLAFHANRAPPAEKLAVENRQQSYNSAEEYRPSNTKEEEYRPERHQSSWPAQENPSTPKANQRNNFPQHHQPAHARSRSHTPPGLAELRIDAPSIKSGLPSSLAEEVFGVEHFTEENRFENQSQVSGPEEEPSVSPQAPFIASRNSPPRAIRSSQSRRPELPGGHSGGTQLKPPPGSLTPPPGWMARQQQKQQQQLPPADELTLPSASADKSSDEASLTPRHGMSRRTAPGGGYPAPRNGTTHRPYSRDAEGLTRNGSREGMVHHGFTSGHDPRLGDQRAGDPNLELGSVASPRSDASGRYSSFGRQESALSEASEVSASDWNEHRRYSKVSTQAQRAAAAILASAGVGPTDGGDEEDPSDMGGSVRSEMAPVRPRVAVQRVRRHSMTDLRDYHRGGEDAVSSPRAAGGAEEGEALERPLMRGRLAEREEVRRQRMQEQERLLQSWQPIPDASTTASVPLSVSEEEEQPVVMHGRGGGSLDMALGKGQSTRNGYDGVLEMPPRRSEGVWRREGQVDQLGIGTAPRGNGVQQRGRGEGPGNGMSPPPEWSNTQASDPDGGSNGAGEQHAGGNGASQPSQLTKPMNPAPRPVPAPPTREQPDLQALIASGASDITIVFETARAQRNRGGNRLHVPAFNDAVNQNIKSAPVWQGLSDMPTVQENPPPPAPAPPRSAQPLPVPAHVAAPPSAAPSKPKKKSWLSKFTK
eukprot:TRINITY_DN2513_c0_g1_i1.p1 TRINITY_DN2513_c0_g1~~TRINITY_DN2513_c0_g1_i1.p1  ORF type:complete len:832 (+),score=148.40 TRINITY_DN2513_c0_g1_i1:63-2558(+)